MGLAHIERKLRKAMLRLVRPMAKELLASGGLEAAPKSRAADKKRPNGEDAADKKKRRRKGRRGGRGKGNRVAEKESKDTAGKNKCDEPQKEAAVPPKTTQEKLDADLNTLVPEKTRRLRALCADAASAPSSNAGDDKEGDDDPMEGTGSRLRARSLDRELENYMRKS